MDDPLVHERYVGDESLAMNPASEPVLPPASADEFIDETLNDAHQFVERTRAASQMARASVPLLEKMLLNVKLYSHDDDRLSIGYKHADLLQLLQRFLVQSFAPTPKSFPTLWDERFECRVDNGTQNMKASARFITNPVAGDRTMTMHFIAGSALVTGDGALRVVFEHLRDGVEVEALNPTFRDAVSLAGPQLTARGAIDRGADNLRFTKFKTFWLDATKDMRLVQKMSSHVYRTPEAGNGENCTAVARPKPTRIVVPRKNSDTLRKEAMTEIEERFDFLLRQGLILPGEKAEFKNLFTRTREEFFQAFKNPAKRLLATRGWDQMPDANSTAPMDDDGADGANGGVPLAVGHLVTANTASTMVTAPEDSIEEDEVAPHERDPFRTILAAVDPNTISSGVEAMLCEGRRNAWGDFPSSSK